MKDYQNIFTKWSYVSTEDLKAVDDAGARVALALRTEDAFLKQRAIEQMDMDTYNIISAIPLLKTGSFADNIRMYDSVLVPTLIHGTTLNLIQEYEVLLYAVEQLLPVAEGFLSKIIKHLDLLRKKPIVRNCKNYLTLLSFGYSDFMICYLNYKWLRKNASTVTLQKLQENVLSELFSQDSEFTEEERDVVKLILADIPYGYDAITWTSRLVCASVTNELNWQWLHSLCKEGTLAIDCIRVNPLLSLESDRFQQLSYDDKINCLDHNVGCAITDSAVFNMLERLEFSEYLDTLKRKLPQQTFSNAIRIGLIQLADGNPDNVNEYLQGLPTKEAFEYFMVNPKVQSLAVIKGSRWSIRESDFFKDYLNPQDQRIFISKILDIIYNEHESMYVSVISDLLMYEETGRFYDKKQLFEIVEYIRETFKNEVNSYKLNKMLRNVMGDEEYEIMSLKLREEEELNRLKAEEEKTAKQIEEITSIYGNCTNYFELEEQYKNLRNDRRYKRDLVSKLLLDVMEKYDNVWEDDESFMRLWYNLWESNIVNYQKYKQHILPESEVC